MVLTNDQSHALATLVDFINKEPVKNEDYFYTLAGYAGTGKSTLMNIILKSIKSSIKVVVSAPTHTAKEVIESFTNKNAETIQALLGLRPNVDLEEFNPNKPMFDVMAPERIKNYHLVVIDEASMLGKAIVKKIEDSAILNGVKIIYMGDEYQLPPIGEIISIVFKKTNIVRLNEIVRQTNSNPNVKLIELARNDVRDQTDTFLPYLKSIKLNYNNLEGYSLLKREEYYPAMLEKYFDTEYKENLNLVKTLAWRNNTVSQVNNYIRSRLIKSTEMVAKGDVLTGYKSIMKEVSKNDFVSVVKNSVTYSVQEVELIEKVLFGINFKLYKVRVKGGNLPMFILHRESYYNFVVEYSERLRKAKEYRQWKAFYTFKDNFVIMETLRDSYNNVLCDKDIDYGYCITVHKSQGSTYTNVGVTLADLIANPTPQERRKLIYVASSRTSLTNTFYV